MNNRIGRSVLILCLFLFSTLTSAESVPGIIKSITDDYGNLNTSVTADQLDELSISPGSNYTVQHKGTKVSVHYGTTYSDVPTGEWISFALDDGTIRIARNFENAAATLEASNGDEIIVSNLK